MLTLSPSPLISFHSSTSRHLLTRYRVRRASLLLLHRPNMEKPSPQEPKSTSAHSQLDESVFPNRLVEIADAYPDNPIVRYLVAPFARHFFKWESHAERLYTDSRANHIRSLLAVYALIFGSLITCNFWNDDKVCDGRFLSVTFYVGLGFMLLICYTGYLRRKLGRQRPLSPEA